LLALPLDLVKLYLLSLLIVIVVLFQFLVIFEGALLHRVNLLIFVYSSS
jgi:hypothetical protein